MAALGLEAFPVATQTYPRKQDWLVLNALAGLAGSLYSFAFDLRLLQSPLFGEWSEPFGSAQVGSSAMPFKRNPVNAENLDSLARLLAALPRVAWDNAAHSLLERTLDDSANRRLILPEAFLIADEMLVRSLRLIDGLLIDDRAVARNLAGYGAFAATERLLMELVRAGADRQAMHERIRRAQPGRLAGDPGRPAQPAARPPGCRSGRAGLPAGRAGGGPPRRRRLRRRCPAPRARHGRCHSEGSSAVALHAFLGLQSPSLREATATKQPTDQQKEIASLRSQ